MLNRADRERLPRLGLGDQLADLNRQPPSPAWGVDDTIRLVGGRSGKPPAFHLAGSRVYTDQWARMSRAMNTGCQKTP
jgi:hypothetical protein